MTHSQRRTRIWTSVAFVALTAVALILPAWWQHSETVKLRIRYDAALSAAQAGRFYWDLTTGEMRWDAAMYTLLGTTPETRPDNVSARIDKYVVAEDRSMIVKALTEAIAHRSRFTRPLRIITDDGTARTLRVYGTVDADGLYMTGLLLPANDGEFLPQSQFQPTIDP